MPSFGVKAYDIGLSPGGLRVQGLEGGNPEVMASVLSLYWDEVSR